MNPFIKDQIVVTIDGVEYEDIVPYNYKMNPKTEDLLFSNELVDGMVVLTETGRTRETMPDGYSAGLLVTNRWCTVTKIFGGEGETKYFIGVYADGVKTTRHAYINQGWLVKLDSTSVMNIPNSNTIAPDDVVDFLNTLKDASKIRRSYIF